MRLFAILLAAAATTAGAAAIPASDPHVSIMGRTQLVDAGGVRFSYPGVTFALNFEGTQLSASVVASGPTNYVDVIVDGAARKLHLQQGRQTLMLAEGLAPGQHAVSLVNRTETWQGTATLEGFDTDGAWQAARQLSARKLLLLGDSITCGAAIDRVPGDENGAASGNPRASYGMLLAQRLEAQVQLVCYGGRGLIRTWEGKTDELKLADYYGMAIPSQSDAAPWDQRNYRPDAILVAIGTNDMTTGIPEREHYVAAYTAFVHTLLRDHPQAQIMLTEGGILTGEKQAALRSYIEETVRRAGDPRVHAIASTGYPGDDKNGHPTREQNLSIVNDLLPQVKAVMRW